MMRSWVSKTEILIIVVLASVPMFVHLPYRVNIFLSWEGAYRISEGQLPFRDFGIPLGGMYWVVPAIFFKLFGVKMITLIKAQVFMNIVAGLAFRSILRSLSVDRGIRLASVLLFCISYSFFNFWPWYNHSVIVYELVALAALLRYMPYDRTAGGVAVEGAGTGGATDAAGVVAAGGYRWLWLVGAAFFTCCSFLTKQDGGGLTFFICCLVLAVYGWLGGRWKPLLVYAGSFVAILTLLILPFLKYGIGYWFNHGQPPHTARVSAFDIVTEFFASSQWIKFYWALSILLLLIRYRRLVALRADPATVLLVVLTWGILGEAAILAVTSYTPPDNNIFFHSFGFACVLSLLVPFVPAGFGRPRMVLILCVVILGWWSRAWWNYVGRIAGKFLPKQESATVSRTGENIVNKDTYMIYPDAGKDIPMDQWVECGLPAFSRISMPQPTVDGIRRLLETEPVKSYREKRQHSGTDGGQELRVLNMSELTPLAKEIPFSLERNGQLPLWYHLGVGMFNRQADSFETRIRQHYYDLVLFEYIPTLNNFYPFRVRDSLHVHYNQVDSFMAPRRGPETMGVIEVFVKPAR